MKKRTIIIICICLAVVLLIGSALLVSYDKFGTVNVFSSVTGYLRVRNTDAPYLSNGRDTLWDTQTEELADEICADCETDEEKVLAFYNWIIANLAYNDDCYPLFQYFDVRKTLKTKQGTKPR